MPPALASDPFPHRGAVAMWVLVAVIAANTLLYASAVANPMIMADNWIFVDTFLRHVIDGNGDLGDFLVKRRGFDHGLPHFKLMMLLNAWWLGLDFRFEAIAGAVFAVAGWWVLARTALSDAPPADRPPAAYLALAAVAAVQLSLNAFYTWLYSMVALGFLDYLLAFLAFGAAWGALQGARTWLFACWILLYAVVADTSATIAGIAVAMAILHAGWRLGRMRRALGLVGIVVAALVASRLLYATYGEIRGETLAVFNAPFDAHIAGLVAHGSDAWRWGISPLASGVAWKGVLEYFLRTHWQLGQVVLGLVVAAAHVWFWWRALRDRPRAAAFMAVCLMLLFYGYIAGVLYGRVFVRGSLYFDQDRYVSLYQIGILALLLMATSRALDRPRHAPVQRMVAACAVLLLAIQVPLTLHSRGALVGIHSYYRAMAGEYGHVIRNPGPDRTCVDQLTVCGLGPELRIRVLDMLRRHQLNVFSPAFARRHPELAAAVGPLPGAD
ncbi:MAG TPA: hypothetical protein VLK29_09650 [Luteimonas sp.]|nr:hypothetical protein [Luteimonas sp.]